MQNPPFFEGGSAFNVLFYVLLAACCLFFAVVSFLSSDGKKVDLVCLKDKNAAVASIIFAVGLLYDWLDSFFESSVIFGGITEVAYLKRITFGSLNLDESLNKGEYRLLTDEEVNLLKK